MKNTIKKIVRENMRGRRIVLFGATVYAEAFYTKYKDTLNISHCVTNNCYEWGERCFLDELDVFKYDVAQIMRSDYIVVCAPVAFRQIEAQLLEDGFEMFKDFIEAGIADAIYQDKRILLFYGNCIIRDVYECIVRLPEFFSVYAPIYTQQYKNINKHMNRVLFYSKDLCDAYLYSPNMLDRDQADYLTAHELPEGCKSISISNITFHGYFPQINIRLEEYNERYCLPYKVKRNLTHGHTLYRRSDVNINRMVEEGKNPSEIASTLSRKDYYDKKAVLKNLKGAFRMIEVAEYGLDIKMLDYVKNRYRGELLFQNFVHMRSCVIWEYVRRILAALGIEDKNTALLEAQSPKYIHHGGDVPIYPSVAEGLELEFIGDGTVYEVMTYEGIVPMTFTEYIDHYARYTYLAKEINEKWW